jgi:hypothetical protein
MPEPQPTDRLVFTLSQEELYVLLTYLKTPAPVELDDFEAQVVGSLAPDQKVVLLRAVERCLLAREYLKPNEDRTLSVNAAIATVIQACATPEQSWFVLNRRREQTATTLCFHRRGELIVSLYKPLQGMHHFVAFADRQLAEQAILGLLAPGEAKAMTCAPGTIPMTILGLLMDDSNQFDAGGTAARLLDAGLDPTTAAALTHSLEGMQSITVLTRVAHSTGAKPAAEVNVTVIADGSTLWLLAQESAERLSVGSIGAEDLPMIVSGVLGQTRPSTPGN